MLENAGLIETSWAEAIVIITASPELPEQTRRHWATSLRQIAKVLDRPLEVIPARYSAVRADLLSLHEVPAGLTAKTLQNHKSNVKSALLWLAREKGIPEHGAPLSPECAALMNRIPDPLVRMRLSSFFRYLSANNIKPLELDEAEEKPATIGEFDWLFGGLDRAYLSVVEHVGIVLVSTRAIPTKIPTNCLAANN